MRYKEILVVNIKNVDGYLTKVKITDCLMINGIGS
jgi:hypothetical protein